MLLTHISLILYELISNTCIVYLNKQEQGPIQILHKFHYLTNILKYALIQTLKKSLLKAYFQITMKSCHLVHKH